MAFKKKVAKKNSASRVFKAQTVSLALLKPGQRGVIASIQLQDPAYLHRLTSFGLIPGTAVVVERVFPVLSLRLPYAHLFIDEKLAEKIFIHVNSVRQ